MKRTILALAAASALAGFGSAAHAMAEFEMVQDTLRAFLIELRIPSEEMDKLTLAQMREIISIVDSKKMNEGVRAQVLKIIGEN